MSNIFSEFKFCTELFKLCKKVGKITEQELINASSDANHIFVSKRKAREHTMCTELLVKKQASTNVFTIIKNLGKQQNYALAFANESAGLVLIPHLNNEEARSAMWHLTLNGGLLAKIQAIAYVAPIIVDYDDEDTMSLIGLLDRTIIEQFDVFIAMIDFGNKLILQGVIILASVFSRMRCLHGILCTSTLRLSHALHLDDPTFKLMVESALFQLVSPAALPVIEFYINHTLPNLTYKNEGDFTFKCKDGDLKCHKIVLESAETSHFRSFWLKNEDEYEEKETHKYIE